jgi:hypothetical protein
LQKKKVVIGIGVVILIILVLLLIRSCSNSGQSLSPTEKQTETKTLDFTPYTSAGDSISIPAVTGLNFKAGQFNQQFNLTNPPENKCYFRLSLFLSDNTLIYQSDMIAPSETIAEITLNQVLERGLYRNCQLVFDCFSLENRTPLNSANVQLEINSN